MDLSFDVRGNLKPYQKNNLTLEEFKAYFVDAVKIYPENHQKHFMTESNLLYWEIT